MVRGLEIFKKHFANYSENFVLIGGTACSLIMEDAGLNFRATKDLDIVLYIEALDEEFVSTFWEFVRSGGYQNRQRSTGKKIFYRFCSPTNRGFPEMLELFSRMPDVIQLDGESCLTPIPVNEAVSSLSAILLDDNYYQFIHSGKKAIDGIPVVNVSHLIPLKARAWLDLVDRKSAGANVDEKDIRKHKNDVLRLYQLLSPTSQIMIPQSIKRDMKLFLDCLANDQPVDLKNLGLKHIHFEEALGHLRQAYQIDK